jgi:nanoRNase/pAp phosphatase (c-di-AMP/oligoRNAs hydrolase)
MPIEQQIYQKIIAAQKILIITHYNPDGDALSSLSVFSCILKSLNKKLK